MHCLLLCSCETLRPADEKRPPVKTSIAQQTSYKCLIIKKKTAPQHSIQCLTTADQHYASQQHTNDACKHSQSSSVSNINVIRVQPVSAELLHRRVGEKAKPPELIGAAISRGRMWHIFEFIKTFKSNPTARRKDNSLVLIWYAVNFIR